MTEERPSRRRAGRFMFHSFGLILACLVLMWAVEIVDSVVLGDRLQRNGVGPRRIDGLDGVLWHPWLHSTYGHVLSNTVPLAAMGYLVSLRGRRYWIAVSIGSWLMGGALTWLFAGGLNHIGASGVVFGYFGALLGGAVFDRRPAVLAPALITLLLYSSLLAGIVPQDDISWEGHLFGLIAGLVMSRVLAEPPPPRRQTDDSVVYPWEIDEPWLDTE